MRQIVAISILIITLLLLITNPSVLADIFMVLFNFVSKLVNGIQEFTLEVFNRIT